MAKVGFSGYYGMGNFGDDLFAWTSIEAAKAYWPQQNARLIAPEGIGLVADYGSFSKIPVRIYQGLGLVGKAARFCTLLSGALSVDRFVFSGGSLFHSDSSAINRILPNIGRVRPTAFSAIGVSIGPFDSLRSEREAKGQLSQLEFLSVHPQRKLRGPPSHYCDSRESRRRQELLLFLRSQQLSPLSIPRCGRKVGLRP